MVYHAEGIAGRLTVTDKIAVGRLLLRVKMVVKDLVETTQAHAGRLFFFIITNPRPTPNALDQESYFLLFVHKFSLHLNITLLKLRPR